MRIAVFGGNGLLGQALTKVLMADHVIYTPEFSSWRTDPKGSHSRELIVWAEKHDVGLFINSVGINDWRRCQQDPAAAEAANCFVPNIICTSAVALDIPFVHFSCFEAVCGGDVPPAGVSEDGGYAPVGAHGRMKALSEYAVNLYMPERVIIRVGKLFGPGRKSYLDHVLASAVAGVAFKAGVDQVFSPTYTVDVAAALKLMIASGPIPSGVYHLVNNGAASPVEFAEFVLTAGGLAEKITCIERASIRDERRPANLTLANTKRPPLRDWREAVKHYLDSTRT